MQCWDRRLDILGPLDFIYVTFGLLFACAGVVLGEEIRACRGHRLSVAGLEQGHRAAGVLVQHSLTFSDLRHRAQGGLH